MNQEEWLRMRRELGLPADPAKDFPPGFREAPRPDSDAPMASAADTDFRTPNATERQRPSRPASVPTGPPPSAFPTGPSASGHGGGFGTGDFDGTPFDASPGPTPRTYPNPFASGPLPLPLRNMGVRLGILIGAVILAGILTLVFKGTSGGLGGDKELKEATQSFANSLVSGDLKSIENQLSLAEDADRSLLTPAQAKKVFGETATAKVSYASKRGSNNTSGSGSFTLTKADGSTEYITVRLTKVDGTWRVDPVAMPVLRVIGTRGSTLVVDGVRVTPKPTSGTLSSDPAFIVWPGEHTVEAVDDKFTSYAPSTMTRYTSINPFRVRNEASVPFSPRRTAEYKKAAASAGLAVVKACAKRAALSDKACPYAMSFGAPSSALRDVKLTVTNPERASPSVKTMSIGDRLIGTGPTIVATATEVTASGKRKVTATAYVNYSGGLRVKGEQLVYTHGTY